MSVPKSFVGRIPALKNMKFIAAVVLIFTSLVSQANNVSVGDAQKVSSVTYGAPLAVNVNSNVELSRDGALAGADLVDDVNLSSVSANLWLFGSTVFGLALIASNRLSRDQS